MNIVLDIGNTRSKIGLYSNYELVTKLEYNGEISPYSLNQILNKHQIESGIVSSTTNLSIEIADIIRKHRFLVMDQETPLPINNRYKTPETLGRDRIAGAIASTKLFPNQDCLIIDMGTCITYDFIDKDKAYFGGAISPGKNMRFKALNSYTGRLPLVEKHAFIPENGQSTTESLNKGVMNGIVHEINGFIRSYLSKHPNLKVILTGGDASLFEQHIENPIFAAQNLILDGLNLVLLYNKQLNE